MIKFIKKTLFILIIILSIMLIIGISKIIVNNQFIKNYPHKSQEYRLKINSFANFYEPYVVYYNYGNYLYEQGKFLEASEKYQKALDYSMSKENACKLRVNLSLSLLKQINEDDSDEKKQILEDINKYLSECNVYQEKKITNNVTKILFIIILIIVIILALLGILLKIKGLLIPKLNIIYLNELEKILSEYQRDTLTIKEAYSKMSYVVREFVYKKTKINILNLTKKEIEKLNISKLNELVSEYYQEQFSKKSKEQVIESINKSMEVIRKWN